MKKTLKAHYAPRTVARIKARLAGLGTIHAAKTQLKLDEPAYRAMVKAASKDKTDSSADLDARGRAKLIRALVALGYKEPAAPSARSRELSERRLRDLGAIHMGARALGLEDEAYRALVVEASEGKTRTSADMNAKERSKLIGAMRGKGFEPEAA